MLSSRDAMEPVAQRAAVDANFRGCGGEVPAVIQVARQGRHQLGAAVDVVVEHSPEPVPDEYPDVALACPLRQETGDA
jgi:hypothetical protein